MSPRALAYSMVALAVLLPCAAGAGEYSAFTPPVASPVAGGSQAVVACTHTCTSMLGSCSTIADRMVFTTTAGAFPSGATTETVMFAAPASSGGVASIAWTTPGSAGSATLTCQARNATTVRGTAATANVTVSEPQPLAPVLSEVTGPAAAVAESSNAFAVVASDPGGLPITYSWTASGGAFAPASPAGASATWIAPAAAGTYTVTVTATNGGGASSTRSTAVQVVVAVFQASLEAAMRGPRRLAVGDQGDVYVADGNYRLSMLTRRGELRASPILQGVTAVAASGGVVYAGTDADGIVAFNGVTSRVVGRIPYAFARGPDGMAVDPARGRVWVANYDAGTAYALMGDGGVALQISSVGTRKLLAVTDVAFDATRDEIWVAERACETGPMVHAFRGSDAGYLRSYVVRGSTAGQVMSVGGVAVENGKLFVSDAFTGTVQVLAAADGTPLGTLGQKGIAAGDLNQPRGVALLANGDLAVANSALHRIDRYGSGAPLPVCDGDRDCDGLPDAWEVANGLNPDDASDALTDLDADGLFNAEELALATDPRRSDTDGDLIPDGQEVLAGTDPLDGPANRPVVSTAATTETRPGLVRMGAIVSGGNGCAASWRQLGGASVSLRGADTFNPSFVARARGAYRFEVVASCTNGVSLPAVADVVVLNVRPIADAGPAVVSTPGQRVNLSGSFSSDANGDELGYAWRQLAGPATSVVSRGAVLAVRPAQPGFYAYELTATDTAGERGSTVVPVVVTDGLFPTAAVAVPVILAAVGSPVTLDATPSWPSDVTFSWQQVEPAEEVALGSSATASYTPTAPGRYVFEVTAWKAGLRSPPARVIVLAGEGGVLPTAMASAPPAGSLGAALSLDGSASSGSGPLLYAWRQVEGPAAGLTDAERAVATVVPFVAGAYSFELTVTDSKGSSSAGARVSFSVSGAKAVPFASASAPVNAEAGELVLLDGRASAGGGRYRWTQLSGPWVAIDGNSATPTFAPAAPGSYRFQLIVDDGVVRSAPALVTVDVK